MNKQQTAKTPLQLMRSRYCAYALGGYGDYLLESWLPVMTQGLSAAELSFSSRKWVGLDILNKSQTGEQGIVEFKAYYLGVDGQKSVQHEKSLFKRIKGRWFYVSAQVSA